MLQSNLDEKFIAECKAKLLQKRAELEEEISSSSKYEVIGSDQSDQAIATEIDEVNRDIRENAEAELFLVNKALDKIESGEYGFDDEGNPIPMSRLNIMPWADHNVN